jgi:tetratricopeptide (TPR) repeat protein|tara:strand:- start:5788 stop:6300 length:513 start_codon:yes stop_codon:yes gene_type:complete
MIKFLTYLNNLSRLLLFIIVGFSVLALTGIYNPAEHIQSYIQNDVIEKLRNNAEEGNVEAQNKLGTLLYTIAQEQQGDFSEAIMWLEKAHQQNNPIAELNLAFAYKSGQGVTPSNERAIELYYQAGINFLQQGFPMDAKDCVYEISQINTIHPLRRELINAIKAYEAAAN